MLSIALNAQVPLSLNCFQHTSPDAPTLHDELDALQGLGMGGTGLDPRREKSCTLTYTGKCEVAAQSLLSGQTGFVAYYLQ